MTEQNYYKLKRVYCPENFTSTLITIDDKKLHHLLRVIRVKSGDLIRVFNAQYGEWLAKIDHIEKNKLHINLEKQLRDSQSGGRISLMFAPIKHDKLHFLIEKSVELGVDKLIPILTERTIVRDINMEKTESYILQSVEQSERLTIPKLFSLNSLSSALENLSFADLVIFCNEQEQQNSLKKTISNLEVNKNYIILVGPEGGFTSLERQILNNHKKVISTHIGPRILRAETAAAFVIGCLQFALGDMDFSPRA
jgi:16S rRNA (uracil1498-N3)-methyltransferase